MSILVPRNAEAEPFCACASEGQDHVEVLHCTVPLGLMSQDKQHQVMGLSNTFCYSELTYGL